MSTYGEPIGIASRLASFAHGLTTMDGMVAVITSIIGGTLAGVVAAGLGVAPAAAAPAGLAVGGAEFAALAWRGLRHVARFEAGLQPRFPTPGTDPDA